MDLPKELKYAKTHEYLKAEGSAGTIGISSYASNELGDIVFVELPEVGTEFKSGEKFGVIESVKSVSDLYSPIDGKVVEINNDLADHPEFVNEEPYGKGWMIKLELAGAENSELITSDEYGKFILTEAH